jgi:hypothetical protein
VPRAPKQLLRIPPEATIADYPALAAQLDPAAGPAKLVPTGTGRDVGSICNEGPDHRWKASGAVAWLTAPGALAATARSLGDQQSCRALSGGCR